MMEQMSDGRVDVGRAGFLGGSWQTWQAKGEFVLSVPL